MTLLYNFGTQTIENVPEDKVTDLVASGTYAPRTKVRVPVIAPDGVVGSIPSESAQSAFLQGFKFQTSADSAARAQAGIEASRAAAFDRPGLAATAGVLRGATFGLSDVAGAVFGQSEGLAELKEQNPVASTLGEVGGAISGAFTPISAVGKVAGLGADVAKSVGASTTIADIAAKGTAGKIAAEILSKGAGSAVEGAFYGAGELMSEAALGDPNLTAQNAALVFGANVLGGGVIGGLVPGAATAVSELKNKIGKILVEDMNVPAKAMNAYGKLIAKLKISDPEQQLALKELAEPTIQGRQKREVVFDLMSNPNKASDYAVDAVNQIGDVGKWEADALGSIREGARQNLERVKYGKGDKLTEVAPITSALASSIKTATEKSNRYVGGAASDLADVLSTVKAQAQAANNLADMHKAIHDGRMLLDDLFEGVRKSPTTDAINTKKLIGTARKEMTDTLHSEKMFPGLGANFKDADAAFSEYLTTAKNFRTAFQKKVSSIGGEEYQTARGKAASLVKNPLSDIAMEKAEVFERMSNAVESLNSISSKMAGLGTDNLQRTVGEIKTRLDKVQNARNAAILLNRMESMTGRSTLGSIVGFGLGSLAQESGLIDVPGAGMAGLVGGALLANPKTVMTYLMRLERGNHQAAMAIEEGVNKVLGLPVPATAKGAASALWGGRNIGVKELAKQIRSEDGDQGHADIGLLKMKAAPLDKVQEMDGLIKAQNPLLDDIAPNTYSQMVNGHTRAMAYVKAKLPPDRDALFAGESVLSTSQMISLNRQIAAAFNPGELIHQMNEGDVRPETVEAVRTVYPEIFGQIQKQISTSLATPGAQKKMSRHKKLQLQKVLGIPTTPATQNMGLLQASWETDHAAHEQEGQGISEATLAQNQTDTEAVQNRRLA